MHSGFAIALAWPETFCKQTGAWYDRLLSAFGINQNGYYKVGHSALVLVDDETGSCRYFDFGRYHAPPSFGRVRSQETDHELTLMIKARISSCGFEINNLKEILAELYKNKATHGSGGIRGTATRINYESIIKYVMRLQEREQIPYGPFAKNGTNCSRFVNSAIRAGKPTLSKSIKLNFAPMLTPTPAWNLKALGSDIMSVESGRQEIFNQVLH